MTPTAFWFFALGLVLGSCIGLVTFALMHVAKTSDQHQDVSDYDSSKDW